jgi:hypothetical protein
MANDYVAVYRSLLEDAKRGWAGQGAMKPANKGLMKELSGHAQAKGTPLVNTY